MKIALIYNKASGEVLSPANYFERVLAKTKIEYDHFALSAAEDIPLGYDLYFRVDHGDYKHTLPTQLRPSVFYAIDTHLKKPFQKIKQQAKGYDIIFCAQYTAVQHLRKWTDCQWAPLGCDPDIHRDLNVTKKHDIAFVGRDAKKFDRGRHLKIIRKNFSNIFIGEVASTEIATVYSAAKIGFNSSIINDMNMRTFEVMACGSLLLTNKINNEGFDRIFQDKTHLVTFTNDRDLIEKIRYYLAHDDERERIALAGKELVRENYTYYHTLQRIFNYIAFKFSGPYNSLRI